MEGNYLTSGDLAMWDTARTGRHYYDDCGGGYGCGRRGGAAATGIGLGIRDEPSVEGPLQGCGECRHRQPESNRHSGRTRARRAPVARGLAESACPHHDAVRRCPHRCGSRCRIERIGYGRGSGVASEWRQHAQRSGVPAARGVVSAGNAVPLQHLR